MIHSVHILLINSGLPLFSAQFDKDSTELDETLASGLFAALRSFATEIVSSEEATEPEIISMSGFKIIYATKENLACVALVDNAISDPAIVRERLLQILMDFSKKYTKELAEIPFIDTEKFSNYFETVNSALDKGRFAHEPQVFPLLKDEKKLSRLVKMGLIKKDCSKVAELCDGTHTISDIVRALNLSHDVCEGCINKLKSQKIIEVQIEGEKSF
ncbi:MAG: hypothetical protein ACFFC7_22110 [Candidatus Hermodarchaeota archaeon]